MMIACAVRPRHGRLSLRHSFSVSSRLSGFDTCHDQAKVLNMAPVKHSCSPRGNFVVCTSVRRYEGALFASNAGISRVLLVILTFWALLVMAVWQTLLSSSGSDCARPYPR